MPDTGDTPSTLLGVHFVYDSGPQKIEQQEKLIDWLDVKMGVLVGLLGTFIVGLVVAALTSEVSRVAPQLWLATKAAISVGIALTGACLFFAFQAFGMRQQFSGVQFRDLVKWTNEKVETTKEAFLPEILACVGANDRHLIDKRHWAGRAIRWVFFALGAFWVSLLPLGAQSFLGEVSYERRKKYATTRD